MSALRLIAVIAFLSGCATAPTYHQSGDQNFHLDLNGASDYQIFVYQELPNCKRHNLGRISIDQPNTQVRLPTNQELLLSFEFSSGYSQRTTDDFWIRIQLGEQEKLELLYREKNGSTQKSFYLVDPRTGEKRETDGLPSRPCAHFDFM